MQYTGETESDFTTRGDQAHFEEKVAAFTAARGNTPLPGGGSRFVLGAWPLRLAPPHLMRVALRFLCLPALSAKDSADAEIADCPGPTGATKRC